MNRARIASIARRAWLPLLLCLAPIVVFHPIVFSHYTLSLAWPSVKIGTQYGNSDTIPVLDPGAAAAQDESWLVLERRLMSQGELPVFNMNNGLGAPLLESLQPGAFYLLNPLLFLFDPRAPSMFDGFTLLHVSAFIVGLFFLARLYARPSIAAVAALAVGFSGVTYQHLDMVHYRSVIWLPFALNAAIRFARGTGGRGTFALFVFAHVAALTAGAVQEAFISSVAIACVFAFELWSARTTRRESSTRVRTMALAAISSSCIAAAAIVPYLKARALGDLFTAAGPDRATQGLGPGGLATLLVPHINGFWPYMFSESLGTWLTDFSTSGMLFVLIAVVCAIHARPGDGVPRRVALCIAVLCALTLSKVQHFAIFDCMSKIPFLSEIRFVKYHYFLFVLFAILIAIGLEAVARMDALRRRRVIVISAAMLAIALIPIAALFVSSTWVPRDSTPAPVWAEACWSYGGSAFALLASIALLYRSPRGAMAWLALLMLALGVCVRPNGWMQRAPLYQTPAEASDSMPVLTLLPARTTDENWDHGVAREDNAGFFVQNKRRLRGIEIGSRLRFALSGERRVQSIKGDQVWVDGALLDPIGDGAPNVVEIVDPLPVKRQRIVSLLGANQNVISGFESLWVFDPICNARLREFLAERFQLNNPWFELQASYSEKKALTSEQIDWLRFLGVTRIYHYKVEPEDGLVDIGSSLFEVENELPRILLLGRNKAREIGDQFGRVPISQTLADLRAEIAAQPAVTELEIGARDIRFHVERDFDGVLVATQAFSHGWRCADEEPLPFCFLYPAWDVTLEAGLAHTVAYDPPGLPLGFAISAFGLGLAVISGVFFQRRRARDP